MKVYTLISSWMTR